MRYRQMLGTIWTLGAVIVLSLVLRLRIGYEPALEPEPVWVIEAFFFFFVLWSVGIVLFLIVASILRMINEHLDQSVPTPAIPPATLARSPTTRLSSFNEGKRKREARRSTFDFTVNPGDHPYFWLNYEYDLRGDAEDMLQGTIWEAFVTNPREAEKRVQSADISDLQQITANSYVLNRHIYVENPGVGGLVTFRVVARIRCTSTNSFSSRFSIYPYPSRGPKESVGREAVKDDSKGPTNMFARRSYAAVDILLYRKKSGGADQPTENYWKGGTVRIDDPPKDVDCTEEYFYRIRTPA
jgi:hypothetical protein